MKKVISALLVAAMIGTLAGCGSSKEAAETTTETGSGLKDIEIDASKYVQLGDYKGITIQGEKATVTDEDIQSELDDLRDQYVDFEEVTDRDTVKDDDFLNVDYSCTVDGEAVDDLSESGLDIQLGSGELVFGDELDLESDLVGQKVGSKVTVKGKFDEEDDIGLGYAGQEATFVVTINMIEKEVYPEINDEFIKENMDYDSLEDYKKALKEDLLSQAESDAESDNQAALWEKVVANAKQIKDFPEDMVEDEAYNAVIEEREMAEYMGIEIGESDEEIEDYFQEYYECSLDEYAKDYLFRQCVLDLIVEKENLAPTAEDIDNALEEEKEAGGYDSVDDVLEYSSREDFEQQIIYDRVMDLLEKENTIK